MLKTHYYVTHVTPVWMEMKKLVKYLVARGTDKNKQDNDGNTSISITCTKGTVIDIEFCIDKTSIFMTCDQGYKNIVKYLMEHGADINKQNNRGHYLLLLLKDIKI